MDKKMKIKLKDVWKKFKKTQVVYVATIDAGKPRVRPMILIHHDRKLWLSTCTGDAKVCQISRHPRMVKAVTAQGCRPVSTIFE